MYLCWGIMSYLTSLSIKDKHHPQYLALRNWLKQKNLGMGDYLIEKFNQEFNSNTTLRSSKKEV
jgi:hypothetical protein